MDHSHKQRQQLATLENPEHPASVLSSSLKHHEVLRTASPNPQLYTLIPKRNFPNCSLDPKSQFPQALYL